MKKINLSPNDEMHLALWEDKIKLIMDIVCKFYGLTPEQIYARDRHTNFRVARQLIHYLCRDQFGIACHYGTIGIVTGGGNPYDHASVLHSYNTMGALLGEKTAMGRWANVDLRNEYQVIRGTVIYELNKLAKTNTTADYHIGIWLGEDTKNRLDAYCKSVNISRSKFIRNLIVDKFNELSNGIHV